MSDYFGKEVPKLGFGLMRLPKKRLGTDIEQVKNMVDLFMESGFTYFDTAYVYLGSETAIKKALVDRYPRESYTLATKLNALMMAPTEKAAKKQFYTSLERTGAGYFDYYLLHAMMEGSYTKYERYRFWDFVKEQKAKGLVKYMGFSFHAGPQLLDRLFTEHTRGNREIYARRKETIERIFGTAKEQHGFRYTQYIGKARMEMKAGLTFACMNLKNWQGSLPERGEGDYHPRDVHVF